MLTRGGRKWRFDCINIVLVICGFAWDWFVVVINYSLYLFLLIFQRQELHIKHEDRYSIISGLYLSSASS